MSGWATENFKWAELACHDLARTPYPRDWKQYRGIPLCQEAEILRSRAGGFPLRVTSGYRTAEHNRKSFVGGAPNSRHVTGLALDLWPLKGLSVFELHRVALDRAAEHGALLRGIGLYPGWLHIDIRESARLAHWIDPEARTLMLDAA